jgi:UTP--glucose-1-phosphate uridylyltransferase
MVAAGGRPHWAKDFALPFAAALYPRWPEFAALRDYLARIPYAPNLDECEHLTVSGDVHFGEGVVVKGTVVIVASAGSRLDIPAGAVLDDAIVTGSLRILAH